MFLVEFYLFGVIGAFSAIAYLKDGEDRLLEVFKVASAWPFYAWVVAFQQINKTRNE